MGDNNVNLPPGFRFRPTDEELVVHFLHRKAALLPIRPDVIPDLELYPYDPWQLDGKALGEGKKWYFYSRSTSTKNRITENGYWKSTGVDEPVLTNANDMVGMKKWFVFHVGKEPGGTKTNWILQEYRLSDRLYSSSSASSSSASSTRASSSSKTRNNNLNKDDTKLVICRVYKQNFDDDDDDDHDDDGDDGGA